MPREPEYARPDTHPDFEEAAAPPLEMAAMEEKRMEVDEKEAGGDEKEVEEEENNPVDQDANVGNGNPPAEEDQDFNSLTKPELKELLADRGVNVSARASKSELVALAEEE